MLFNKLNLPFNIYKIFYFLDTSFDNDKSADELVVEELVVFLHLKLCIKTNPQCHFQPKKVIGCRILKFIGVKCHIV